jgi:hypothetical protein
MHLRVQSIRRRRVCQDVSHAPSQERAFLCGETGIPRPRTLRLSLLSRTPLPQPERWLTQSGVTANT